MYRNKKLLERIRQAPICFHCGRENVDDSLIMAAHSNQSLHGKGKSLKADDCYVAGLCHPCHMELDQGSRMSREERVSAWNAACVLTYGWLVMSGHLKLRD